MKENNEQELGQTTLKTFKKFHQFTFLALRGIRRRRYAIINISREVQDTSYTVFQCFYFEEFLDRSRINYGYVKIWLII